MWSSWFFFVTDSNLGLLDSWASTIQLNLVFRFFSDALALFRFTAPVTVELSDFLHGMGSAIGVSNFFLAFFITWLYSSSFVSMEQIPLRFLALSSFGFSIALSCFSFFWAAFPILVQASGQIWSGRVVVWIFVCFPLWNRSMTLTIFCLHQHYNDRQLVFSCTTSRSVHVDLITSICFSGIGNVSSFGTFYWTLGSIWCR